MLSNFEHCVYTKFFFGKDAEKQVGQVLAGAGAKKVLLHHDSGQFLYEQGLLSNMIANLEESGLSVFELGGVQPNPRISLVREGVALCKKENIDYILALGGGSTIDSAKATSMGALYDGDVWDFYSKAYKGDLPKRLPLAVVLTYPATGSESSVSSVLSNDEGKLKRDYSDPLLRPQFAFMNPELTFSLPPYLTACGIVDMFTHIAERYFSPKTDFGNIDYMAESLMRCLTVYGPKVLANPKDYDARAEIMWIGTVAHNNTVGVGRAQDWSSHLIGHEVSGMYDIAHGASLSMVMPAWMRYVYKSDIGRFARYAVEVFGATMDSDNPGKTALEGVERTTSFFRSLNMPVKFSDAGVPTDRLDEIAANAASVKNGVVGSFVPLKEGDILAILEDAAN
ncbi:MAG: iron-containing alcohol dehydrogenase [Oscillospiraceae bacterium]|nr:iron-containing alcohol dehydrogenase [Oscillospiraceae bacterium]